MDFNILKETNIENCENMYALSINYLKKHNNQELNNLLIILTGLENEIRKCRELNNLTSCINKLNQVIDRIEGIINE